MSTSTVRFPGKSTHPSVPALENVQQPNDLVNALDERVTEGPVHLALPLRTVFIRSVGWMGAARVVTNLGTMIRYVLFARLLTPFDFGVFGAATFSEGLLRTMTDPGFARALVPQAGEIESFLDTVWFTMAAQGLAIMAALVIAAKPLSGFFKISDAYSVFIAIAPMTLLISMQSPATNGRIARSLDFRIVFALDLADLLGSFILGGAAILWWRDWRGLVFALTAGQALRTLVTYWYFPYRPRLSLDWGKFQQMFRFGRWVMLRRFTDYAASNLDNLTVGHLLGATPLGEYQMAFRLGGLPCSEVSQTTAAVAFPLAARGRVGRNLKDPVLLSAGGAVVIVGVVYALFIRKWGASVIALTVGRKWLGAYAPLTLLCWHGCARGLMVVGMHILDGLNTPAYAFTVALTSTLVLAAAVFPLTIYWGTVGTAWAALISMVVSLMVLWPLYRRASQASR